MSGATPPGGTPADTPVAVHLVGTGPGPVDLLTVRASRLIAMSGTCLHAPARTPSEALALCPPTARIVDPTAMSTGQILDEIRAALSRGDKVVYLFHGDPLQHDQTATLTHAFTSSGISWELVPGIPHPARGAAAGPMHGPGAQTDGQGDAGAAVSSGSSMRAGPGLILVLGGTTEARKLADLLVTAGLDVVTALAGKVARPRLPRGELRIGEFGDCAEIADWLLEHRVNAVIDATDPFARKISSDAASAARATGIPLLRLERPAWSEAEGDDWIRVADLDSAVTVVRERFRRPMLTVGKHGASAFADEARGSYLIRCSEPPTGPLPIRYLLVLDRGPFGVDSERALMARHRIDVLVTRNSGGESAAAKLEAARALRIPVIVIERPDDPGTDVETSPDIVHTVEDAARWLVGRFGSR